MHPPYLPLYSPLGPPDADPHTSHHRHSIRLVHIPGPQSAVVHRMPCAPADSAHSQPAWVPCLLTYLTTASGCLISSAA